MAKIFGLDIPPGLEDLYYSIVQFANGTTQNQVNLKTTFFSRQKIFNLANRSLFVLWKDLYSGFTTERRHNWDVYWGTLPFGSLGGPDYWPGSGYSAFVYANAPRYRDGLDLLLDPPVSDELIYNGNFSLFGAGWLVDYGAVDFSGQNAVFSPSLGGNFQTTEAHIFTLLPDSIYHIEFDYICTDCDFNLNISGEHGGRYPYSLDDSHAPLTHISDDIYTGSWGQSERFKLFCGAGHNTYSSVDNITLKLKT